jgi:DHA3 family tetracycline resistance protein-like MFS transporter
MQLFSALRHRPFALLFTGQTISRLGDSLYRVALAWWVLEKTGSGTAMGTVLIFSSVPMLIFLLVGGVAVDRLPRLRVMVATDAVSFVTMAAVAALAATGQLAIWHIYVASTVFGLVEAFFFPAYSAAVPELTPPHLRGSANSLTSLSAQLTGIAGPALGAGLVALGGTALTFVLNAASFLLSAACLLPLLRLAMPRAAAPAGPRPNPLHDLRAGFRLVLTTPWLWVGIGTFSLVNMLLPGLRGVALPFLVEQTLHTGVETLGYIYSATSLGSVVGAVVISRWARPPVPGWLMYGGALLSGLMLAAFGFFPDVAVILVATTLFGFINSALNLIWTTTVQAIVPADALGRVFSLDALGSFVFMPIGYGLAGFATDLLGPPPVFILGGLLSALIGGLALLHPAIRRFRLADPAPAAAAVPETIEAHSAL